MYGLGILDRDGVKNSYLDLGYDSEKAEHMTEFTVKYEKDDGTSLLDEYREKTKDIILTAFKKGIITQAEATTRLMALDYDQINIDMLLSLITWSKEIEETPDYSSEFAKDVKAVLEKGYSRRILSKSDVHSALAAIGFGEIESEYITDSVDFWYDLETLNNELKQIGDTYVNRAYNRTDVISKLGTLNIPSEMQEMVLSEWDATRRHRSRRLTEAQYRKALTDGLITAQEYVEALRGLGYSDYDVWILVAMAVGTDVAGNRPTIGKVA